MEKLLLVEDDSALVRRLTEYLSAEGFRPLSASGQTQAVAAIDIEQPDLALVDIFGQLAVILVGLVGFGIAVKTDVTNLCRGNEPFRPKELVSRIRSVLRRSSGNHGEIALGELRVDSGKGLVFRADRQIFLSALEYRLFMFFLNHRGQILTREQLLDEIWDSAGEYVSDNTLTVYIKRLREKLEDDPQDPRLILTVRGIGYQLKE